jgi:hypothetical protein
MAKMEPTPRPTWTSPLEVGVHVECFYSAMSEQPTREVLQALRDDPKLPGFLEKYKLGRLEFSGRLPRPNWRGSFDPPSRDVVVNASRGPETYGKELSARTADSIRSRPEPG